MVASLLFFFSNAPQDNPFRDVDDLEALYHVASGRGDGAPMANTEDGSAPITTPNSGAIPSSSTSSHHRQKQAAATTTTATTTATTTTPARFADYREDPLFPQFLAWKRLISLRQPSTAPRPSFSSSSSQQESSAP